TETDGIFTNLPVIIFDDFTTYCRFVDFQFKVKSSAVKFLKERFPEKNDIKFLFEKLSTLKLTTVGGDHKRRWISEYSKKKVLLPKSKQEQSKIAEILSTVDKAIEQTEGLIAKYRRIKTGLMHDLLTRGIDEQGNIRSEETHCFKNSPLGRIPVEWEVVTWKECCTRIQDGTHFSPKTDSNGKIKYITSKNIKFGYIDLSEVEYIDHKQHKGIYQHCPVKKGDVLLTKDGANTGNCALNTFDEEFSLLSSVAFLRPNKSSLISEYLFQFILSNRGQNMIKDAMSGLAITRITLKIINSFFIKLPSVQEQKKIVSILSSFDKKIKSDNRNLMKLKNIKTALMQDLLTGKVRVTKLLEKEAEAAV
ncbi:restriction endonuclease subunit S, partial [Candidatus Parcubacteria bacterium]